MEISRKDINFCKAAARRTFKMLSNDLVVNSCTPYEAERTYFHINSTVCAAVASEQINRTNQQIPCATRAIAITCKR